MPLTNIIEGASKLLKGRAKKNIYKGMQAGAAPGAAIGGVAGGLHGAVTDDPYNPQEGRFGRILSHAAGGAMLGAGGGAAYGGGKAHIGNLETAAKMKGFAGGLATGGVLGAGGGPAIHGAISSLGQKLTSQFPEYAGHINKGVEYMKGMAGKFTPAAAAPAAAAAAPAAAASPVAAAAGAAAAPVPNVVKSRMAANMGQQATPLAVSTPNKYRSQLGANLGNRPAPAAPAAPAPEPSFFSGGFAQPAPVHAGPIPPENPGIMGNIREFASGLRGKPGWAKTSSPTFWTGFMGRAYREY
jgi:hypothetical protein